MKNLPTLAIHFGPPDKQEHTNLMLTSSTAEATIASSLALPFQLAEIPLVLRALNARQYPDYPSNERLIKPGDDRAQIAAELRALDLWNGSDEDGAIVTDVHARLGRLLGTALLSDSAIRNCFSNLYNAAIQARGGQLVLSFDPKAIAFAALPWEVTHDGPQPLLLTKGIRLNCIRVLTFSHTLPPSLQQINMRLRILTIAPRTQMDDIGRAFEQLARSRMRNILHDLPVDIEPLPQATMEKLYDRLENGPVVDILDYFGHGVFTDKGGALLFENAQGGPDPVSASRLATLPNLPSLIILHACQSAQLDIDEPLAGIAPALSAAGVRAVIAMQLTARMIAATNGVTPVFYEELAAGKSIQQAVATIRQQLYTVEPDGESWYLPVIYLRQADNEPFVLMKRSDLCPPNPFAGEGTFKDLAWFIGREAEVQRISGPTTSREQSLNYWTCR